MIRLIGLPWDASSSYASGAALAPAAIRAMLHCAASNRYTPAGVDALDSLHDRGDIAMPANAAAARAAMAGAVSEALQADERPLALGGDHSVTFPILQAFAEHRGPVNVLHIDAHPDLYPELDGDAYSHASPFARALEAGCIDTLVQLGIRSVTPGQLELGCRYGVTMLAPDQHKQVPDALLAGPLYLSIDLDGLDPAFAPGVAHPEPGGLNVRELLALLDRVDGPIIGADIVELNPEFDRRMQTARVAARLVKELAARMAP